MYTQEQRNIYKYWNGEAMVGADPVRIELRLRSSPTLLIDFKTCELLKNPDTANSSEIAPAWERVMKVTQDAFQVKPFSCVDDKETGLTDAELASLLLDFGQYNEELKKNTHMNPISPNSTDQPSSNGVESNQITSALSVCGLTVSGV